MQVIMCVTLMAHRLSRVIGNVDVVGKEVCYATARVSVKSTMVMQKAKVHANDTDYFFSRRRQTKFAGD